MTPSALTLAQAGAMLGVSGQTLERHARAHDGWIGDGMRAVRVGMGKHRTWVIGRAQVERALAGEPNAAAS